MTSKTFLKLSILSAFLFVVSCSTIPNKNVEAEKDSYDRGTLLDTISKMDSIANILGCALAPASEDCEKFKKEKNIEDIDYAFMNSLTKLKEHQEYLYRLITSKE